MPLALIDERRGKTSAAVQHGEEESAGASAAAGADEDYLLGILPMYYSVVEFAADDFEYMPTKTS
jgi:hypothetical protein